MTTRSYRPLGLPDPHHQPEFYQNVPVKRLIAWVLDMAVSVILSLPLLVFIIVPGLLFWPLLLLITPTVFAVGFIYRWAALSVLSATLGMRVMAIEIRDRDGLRVSGSTAFWHTAGTAFSFAVAPIQAVSALSMILTDRGQGLTDMVLGTTAINRPAA